MGQNSTVKEILDSKFIKGALTIAADTSVFDALRMMAKHNVGALLILENSKLVGIITERDYARKVVLQNHSSKETPVSAIMQTELLAVAHYDTAKYCLELMTQKRIRHLPVFDNGKLIGLVSMSDIAHAVINDGEFMIDQLTRYVTDSYIATPRGR